MVDCSLHFILLVLYSLTFHLGCSFIVVIYAFFPIAVSTLPYIGMDIFHCIIYSPTFVVVLCITVLLRVLPFYSSILKTIYVYIPFSIYIFLNEPNIYIYMPFIYFLDYNVIALQTPFILLLIGCFFGGHPLSLVSFTVF